MGSEGCKFRLKGKEGVGDGSILYFFFFVGKLPYWSFMTFFHIRFFFFFSLHIPFIASINIPHILFFNKLDNFEETWR